MCSHSVQSHAHAVTVCSHMHMQSQCAVTCTCSHSVQSHAHAVTCTCSHSVQSQCAVTCTCSHMHMQSHAHAVTFTCSHMHMQSQCAVTCTDLGKENIIGFGTDEVKVTSPASTRTQYLTCQHEERGVAFERLGPHPQPLWHDLPITSC